MHRSTRLAAALAAAVAGCLLGGCTDGGDAPRRPSDPTEERRVGTGDERRIEQLPGVLDAEVGDESISDESDPVTVAVVDTEAEVSVEELTRILEELDEVAPARHRVFQDAGLVPWEDTQQHDHLLHESGTVDIDAASRAEIFLGATETFPDATVSLRTGGSIDITGPGEGPDAVSDTARGLLEQTWASEVRWFVLGNAPEEGDGARGFRLHAADRMTTGAIELWEEYAATADLVPDPAVVVDLYLDVDSSGRGLSRDTTIELPGVIRPQELTPERYGELLWPVIRAQIDELAQEPDGSSLDVSVRYRTPDQDSASDDSLVYLVAGEDGPLPDEFGRTWNEDAAAYLRQVRGRD